jgi:NTP pyrophosphatase (non-canonical NTP hydrolase)
MEIKDLQKFAKVEHERIKKHFQFKDDAELKHPVMLKIVEEVGELSEAVLLDDSIGRSEKLKKVTKIDEEIADVIISSLILAENKGIDMEKTLKKKIDELKKRSY